MSGLWNQKSSMSLSLLIWVSCPISPESGMEGESTTADELYGRMVLHVRTARQPGPDLIGST